MSRRFELQEKFEKILNSKNVYFQPPENLKMKYPCIRYDLTDIDVKRADNSAYIITDRYQVIYIDKNPDNDVKYELLRQFEHCNLNRTYKAENLHHYAYDLYF